MPSPIQQCRPSQVVLAMQHHTPRKIIMEKVGFIKQKLVQRLRHRLCVHRKVMERAPTAEEMRLLPELCRLCHRRVIHCQRFISHLFFSSTVHQMVLPVPHSSLADARLVYIGLRGGPFKIILRPSPKPSRGIIPSRIQCDFLI